MTDDARRRATEYVRRLADEMGLRDWTVCVLDDPPDDRRKVAEVDCVYGRKRINISLSDQFFRLDSEKAPETQRQTLVHELIHAHLAPMHLLLHRILPDDQWEAYQLPMEYAVDGMAETWAPLLPLPLVVTPEDLMPLKKGRSKAIQEKNFHELKKAHPEMPNKQRVAIVLETARKSKKKAAGKKKAK